MLDNLPADLAKDVWRAILAAWHAIEHAIAAIGHFLKHIFG